MMTEAHSLSLTNAPMFHYRSVVVVRGASGNANENQHVNDEDDEEEDTGNV